MPLKRTALATTHLIPTEILIHRRGRSSQVPRAMVCSHPHLPSQHCSLGCVGNIFLRILGRFLRASRYVIPLEELSLNTCTITSPPAIDHATSSRALPSCPCWGRQSTIRRRVRYGHSRGQGKGYVPGSQSSPFKVYSNQCVDCPSACRVI
ncbi:hypothetical protein ARMSODRAFT_684390 [Armillaria solidipes]|uniref:Uncharacterized protein n=1 Tax=Armillaria solidipes TaxID=1076256 RepID=A0A2H3BAF8_9AGAR|nr:hypothetical protein ARMSODRAFT_684390 [Armillaria solidipes]